MSPRRQPNEIGRPPEPEFAGPQAVFQAVLATGLGIATRSA